MGSLKQVVAVMMAGLQSFCDVELTRFNPEERQASAGPLPNRSREALQELFVPAHFSSPRCRGSQRMLQRRSG